MANEIKVKIGAQWRFCVTASFSPAAAGTNFTIGSPTDVALTLAALASAAGRQSAKTDLGATMAPRYAVYCAVNYTGETPSATGRITLYWMPSASTTAGTGNIGGTNGTDAAAPAGGLGSITLAELQLMAQYIGDLMTHDGAAVQNGLVNPAFSPTSRYGQILLVNNGGDSFHNSNTDSAVWLTEILDEVQ